VVIVELGGTSHGGGDEGGGVRKEVAKLGWW